MTDQDKSESTDQSKVSPTWAKAVIEHGKEVRRGLNSISNSLDWIAIALTIIAITQCSKG